MMTARTKLLLAALAAFGAIGACSSEDSSPVNPAVGGSSGGGQAGASGVGGVDAAAEGSTGGTAGTGGVGGSAGIAGTAGTGGLGGAAGAVDGGGGTGNIFTFPDAADSTIEAGDATSDPNACSGTTVAATLKPSYVLLLLDRSSSMNCNPPPVQSTAECDASPVKKDATQPSKWEILRDAVIASLNSLTDSVPTPSVGVSTFPSDGFCESPLSPQVSLQELDAAQINTIITNLSAVVPKGSSPIVGATMHAYAHLNSLSVEASKSVFLLADGAETCDTQNTGYLLSKASEANLVGLRTFVFGAPGSEVARSFLSALAFNGGTPANPSCDHTNADPTVGDCHADMTTGDFQSSLTSALNLAFENALTCEFAIPGGTNPDPNKVNVSFTNGLGATTKIAKGTGSSCTGQQSVWLYTDATNTKVAICGPLCTTIKGDPLGEVSVLLGCDYQPPQ